jgi:hypothetical protein
LLVVSLKIPRVPKRPEWSMVNEARTPVGKPQDHQPRSTRQPIRHVQAKHRTTKISFQYHGKRGFQETGNTGLTWSLIEYTG